jgi:hypothetical protein
MRRDKEREVRCSEGTDGPKVEGTYRNHVFLTRFLNWKDPPTTDVLPKKLSTVGGSGLVDTYNICLE